MERETYYVIWESGTSLQLSPILPDSQLIHYSVDVNERERLQLEALMNDVDEGDVMPEHVFQSPFDETKDERDKMRLGEKEDDLFHLIYRYGTERTKRRLQELYDENDSRQSGSSGQVPGNSDYL
ncbi:hypothetical protein [Alkalicoccus urumqiensis]|uniref:Uncharacterized protein n=1 Tax=Alkalicoccus urumqiensis TaxID=1548213 RepID=A0A2P6MFS8_ALKUR|nr:hypothetical protein [Alkalicoccus urumqiensis]PRO65100.1 hypothetical protein C6I21_11680 [Alkalicoccus urumqiensis]